MTRDNINSAVAGLSELIGPITARQAPDDAILERDVHVAHLVWMLGKIEPFYTDGHVEKAMRWLGYVQGVCVAFGICTIEQMKRLNKPNRDI